jgi:glucose/mannose transport system permease protein
MAVQTSDPLAMPDHTSPLQRLNRNRDRIIAFLMILPSLVLIGIFVYGFIFATIQTSMTDSTALQQLSRLPANQIGLQNYVDLFTDQLNTRFRVDMVNTVFFTLLFIAACLGVGLLLAILLDQKVRGEGIFRTIFLFPMALSFVVTGVVWKWLFNPSFGINRLPVILGLVPAESTCSCAVGQPTLVETAVRASYVCIDEGVPSGQCLSNQFQWFISTEQWLQFNWENVFQILAVIGLGILFLYGGYRWLKTRQAAWAITAALALLGNATLTLTGAEFLLTTPSETQGFNLALFAVVVAAGWQMSGYTMAMYLAGLRGIPEEMREAARVDGASEFGVYRHIVFPLLAPITLSAVIILGHISLKIFDLVYVLGGGDLLPIDMPGLNMFFTTFRGQEFGKGAAIAVVMLILVAFVIVPYLWNNARAESQS